MVQWEMFRETRITFLYSAYMKTGVEFSLSFDGMQMKRQKK